MRLHDDLVEWVLDDTLRTGFFEPWNDVAHRRLFENRVHRHPGFIAELRDGRVLKRGKERKARRPDLLSVRLTSARLCQAHSSRLPATT